jgi:DNA-binding transcriptional LysR family regulator
MELQQLKAFVAAARDRNITKAARELHTSQPALSKQLKKLEQSYNVKLLVRSGMGVDLTQDGVEFLQYVEPILEGMEELERRFSKRPKASPPTPLRVGGGHAISAIVLPPLLGRFKKEHPQVEVVLRSNTSSTLEQMLIKGSLDLMVTTIAPNSTELIAEPCMRMKIVAVVAKGYSLPNPKVLTLRDVEKLPLIIRCGSDGRGMTQGFFRKLRDQGLKPNILLRCDSPEAIKTAVLKKLGVGILYEDVVKEGLAQKSFKRVRIADLVTESQAYVVYHKQRPFSGSAEAFLDLLRKHCRSTQPEQTTTVNTVVHDVSVERLLVLLSGLTHSLFLPSLSVA